MRMFPPFLHDLYRRAALCCMLCMAAIVPGTACAIDAPWPGVSPDLPAHLSRQTTGSLTINIKAYPESFDQRATDQHRNGFTQRYDWKAPPARSTDWRGIKRDTWYFIGYQFAVLGVLYVAPEDVSGWTDEQKDDLSFTKWKNNAGDPYWDEDDWWINYILHPYWGGAYYIRARERGFDQGQSFLFSALLSTLFEFGAEALFEQPSYQDLVVTPVAGYLVGQYLFAPLRESIRARPGEPNWAGKTVLFLTDPMGVVNAQIDTVFGVKASVSLRLGPVISNESWAVSDQARNPQHDGPTSGQNPLRGWGLHLRMSW